MTRWVRQDYLQGSPLPRSLPNPTRDPSLVFRREVRDLDLESLPVGSTPNLRQGCIHGDQLGLDRFTVLVGEYPRLLTPDRVREEDHQSEKHPQATPEKAAIPRSVWIRERNNGNLRVRSVGPRSILRGVRRSDFPVSPGMLVWGYLMEAAGDWDHRRLDSPDRDSGVNDFRSGTIGAAIPMGCSPHSGNDPEGPRFPT